MSQKQYNLLPHADEIEKYVSELTRSMGGDVGAEEKEQIHEELRHHIEAMVTAEEELGGSRTEAVSHALEKFGDAKKIGHKLAEERRQAMVNPHLRLSIIPLLIGLAATSLAVAPLGRFVPAAAVALVWLCGGLLSGWCAERRRPGYGIDGSLMMALAFSLGFGLCGAFMAAFIPQGSTDINAGMWFERAGQLSVFCLMSALGAYGTAVKRVGHFFPYTLRRLGYLPILYLRATTITPDFQVLRAALRLKETGVQSEPFGPLGPGMK